MLPSILVLSCYMLECGISRSGTRVYLILIDSLRFLSRKAVTAFYDRTVPKSQMAHFVHKLLNSYSEKRGNDTYKTKDSPGILLLVGRCVALWSVPLGIISFAPLGSLYLMVVTSG